MRDYAIAYEFSGTVEPTFRDTRTFVRLANIFEAVRNRVRAVRDHSRPRDVLEYPGTFIRYIKPQLGGIYFEARRRICSRYMPATF